MNNKEEIFDDFELWREHVDPNALMSREEFDSLTNEEKERIWNDCGFNE